ncbi:MAG: DUF4962 domain-containing protein [Saprospiraceae bacterium]|nr:DUF4962 domain-containing protein [Saprospiraceae bacterium]
MHKYLVLGLYSLMLISCSAIFEPDLGKQEVVLLSPPNNYETGVQTQELIWEEIDDASSYRLQIVSENFNYIEDYVLDTTISTTMFTVSLAPKVYEWRVIALNNATESDPTTHKLTVREDTTLVEQLVNTIQPINGASYDWDSVAFLWTDLTSALNYRLVVATDPSFNSQTIELNALIPYDFYYMNGEVGTGTYYWKIKALGSIDSSEYTTTQSFSIDAYPEQNSPANGSTVTAFPLSLNWTSATSNIEDSLYIYYENEALPYRSLSSTSGVYQFTAADTVGKGAGSYYWQLRSVSNTGFLSSYTALREFKIN